VEAEGPRGNPIDAAARAAPGDAFQEVFRDGSRRRFGSGAIVFSEGDVSNRVVLVLSGRLKVSVCSDGGHEVVLGYRERGDLLGEFTAIDGEPHLATVTAVEPTEALVLTADRFLAALEARPDAAMALLRSVIGRLRDADRKRLEFASLDAAGRVARRLIELAERYGEPTDEGIRITLPITQQELAGWVSTSREAVSKSMHRLSERGLIDVQRRSVTVLDLEGLRRRAL
jgi:CRP/FNR family transcriptional regulator, cyclic AMP receptor protein